MAAGHAGRLKDDLLEHFPPPVFMDIDSIPVATRWGQAIEDAIRSSQVVLVLIAKDWMRAQHAERRADDSQSDLRLVPGESRLDDPGDYVRREIETALRYNVPLIPVLIDRAEPPPLDKLPESVRALFDIEAVDLELKRWDDDVSNLLKAVETFFPPLPPPRAPLLVRGPLAVSVPLVILAVNYLSGYSAHSAAWIVLIATAALAALAAASEYKLSRIWAAALVCNCLWFILFAINKMIIQQHLPFKHWKVILVELLAGVLLNVLFFIPALRSALSKKRAVHPLLPVFLGLMVAGLGIASYARAGHENLYQGAALVLFAAVVVDLCAPVLALARRSSARSAAGAVGHSSSSPG
jgi:TIR domain